MDCFVYNGITFASEEEFRQYVNANPKEFANYLAIPNGVKEGTTISYAAETRPMSYSGDPFELQVQNPEIYGEPGIAASSDVAQLQPEIRANKDQLFDSSLGEVNYEFRAATAILNNLDKVRRWEKDVQNPPVLWEKIQRDLGISKAQVELIKNSEGATVEEKLSNFLANYSYTVEVNTAVSPRSVLASSTYNDRDEEFTINGDTYLSEHSSYGDGNVVYSKNNEQINSDEYDKAYNDFKAQGLTDPTDYYSDLSVPGGVNYTENNIITPDITPSIKGHASFQTDNSVGWFRSDDRVVGGRQLNMFSTPIETPDDLANVDPDEIRKTTVGGAKTKTRRILKVQSDLFQKGRELKTLSASKERIQIATDEGELNRLVSDTPEANQFLQLLSKDNNWVTFFIKSIIQDSAKKGYEKVWFPSGNTANKVEGQETLEQYIDYREARLRNLEPQIALLKQEGNPYGMKEGKKYYYGDSTYVEYKNGKLIEHRFDNYTYNDVEIDEKRLSQLESSGRLSNTGLRDERNKLEKLEAERNQFQKELDDALSGKAKFAAINRFYEKDIFNILKKKGYDPTRVKDEYGNEWYEVKIKPSDQKTIAFDVSLSDLAEGMKAASLNQVIFDQQIERLTAEAQAIQKKVNSINDETLRSRMRDALRYVQDTEKRKDLKNFVYFVVESSEVLKYYSEALVKLPQLDLEGQVTLMEKAKVVAANFEDLINFLKKDFRFVEEDNEFKKVVNNMASYYDRVQSIYAAQAEVLAVDALATYLDKDAKIALAKLQKDLANVEDKIAKAQAAESSPKFIANLTKQANDIKKQIITLVPDSQTIMETMKGARGDLGGFVANFRSTLAMGDPIISGYSRRLKEGFNQVRLKLIPIRNQAQDVLENYVRKTGASTAKSMAKFYEGLYEIQDLASVDEDTGEIKSEKFYSLVGPINQAYYNDDLAYRTKIKDLKGKNAPLAEVEAAQRDYNNWLNKYAERKYAESWYERYNLLTPEAEESRQMLLDEMNNILRGPNRDSLTDADVERIGELKYKMRRLGSLRDEDGKEKTGQDLEIAKSIQAFNKKTAEMSKWETTNENRRWFNIILDKKKDQLEKGFITQEDYDRWFSTNTQRNISPEFYAARQILIDKIQAITRKLPKDKFREDIRALWENIFNISRPYRDDDNILEGDEFKPAEVSAVKSEEEKIEELKSKVLRFSGLTLPEEQELQGLWANLETLDENEMQRFIELRDEKENYKAYLGQFISNTELNELVQAFQDMANISKWIGTSYYTTRYNQELHNFRVGIDPIYQLQLKEVEARFREESKWYKDNHVKHLKKNFDGGRTWYTEEDEPLYIWKDIIPTNPKWVEEDAPGFAFKTRIVKPEFVNKNYAQLNNEYFRINDPEEYKNIPKRYVNDNGAVGLSSYINESYERLRNQSTDNDSSAARWEMLQFLIQTHLEGQNSLPLYKRLGYFLPGVVKERYDRYLEHGIKGVKEELTNSWAKITQADRDLVLGDTSQIELSVIPVKYSTKVAINDQNLNLMEGILKSRAAVEEYSYLDSELPTANIIQSALKTAPKDMPESLSNQVMSRLGFKKFIKPTKETVRSKTFNEFVRMMFYGETQKTDFFGPQANKWIGHLLGLASLQVMTFNIPAHITNLLSGEIQNVIEAYGGRYMTLKDYFKAKAIYGANVHNFWNDYSKEGNKSFWGALSDRLDVPQGEFINHYGKKTSFSRLRDWKSHVMIIKQGGEHEMQISTMIAMTLNRKVKLDGRLVSLNEALEVKEGKIRIKAGAELTEEELDRFQDRVQAVVRQLNGAYSNIDRTMVEKTALGRIGFFMKKYFLPMFFRRFESFKYDYEEQEFKEGYYRTAFHIFKDIVKLNKEVAKNWRIYQETLTPEERVNMRRFFSELAIIGILAGTIFAVGGYDRDRELKGRWLYTHMLYQLLKMKSEAETFIPAPGFGWDELNNIFRSPFVPATAVTNMVRTGKDVMYTVFNMPDARFKRDYGIYSEGDLRLKADVLKMLGINPNIMTPENLVKNFELRQR